MSPAQNIGVYFSANDKVYNWTIAFLNSYRTFNPDLPLILIPFNHQCDRLLQLQEKYNFELYNDDASFSSLEAIGKAFELGHTPTGPYWFRRYAAFWGELDRFMYLDARQVVLANLTPLITALDQFNFDFLHYDCAINQVYQPGEFRQQLLRQGRGRGFLSGLWASRKGLFSLEELETLGGAALKIRDQLNPRNTDQAFINYCCDMKPVVYGHFAEVMGGICQNAWARQTGQIYQQHGKYYLWDYGGLDHKKQVILVHWAGYSLNQPIPRNGLLYKYLLINKKNILLFFINALWNHTLKVPLATLRSQRIINMIFHSLKSGLNKS